MATALATLLLFIGLIIIVRYVFFSTAAKTDSAEQQRIKELLAKNKLDNVPKVEEEKKKDRQLPFVDQLSWRLKNSTYFESEDSKNFMSRLELNLIRAGIRDKYTPEQALSSAFVVWAVGFGAAMFILITGIFPKPFAVIFFVLFAYYPVSKLRSLVRVRQEKIAAEIPFFIQQLYMAISSGNTNIDGAIKRVAANNEKDSYDSILSREFGAAQIEYNLNIKTMEEAINDIGHRTGVISVENLCQAIVQGLKTGTPMQEVLLAYSSQAQEMWKQDIRNFKNRKEPVFTIGVVITMFGAFVIMITPMFVGLTDSINSF